MRADVYDPQGYTKLGEIEMDPRCSKDFCDPCGDCLKCFGNGCELGCWWVIYADSLEDAIKYVDSDGSFGATVLP